MIRILFTLGVMLLFGSCYYDNAEDLYPTLNDNNCNPIEQQLSFSQNILPIMQLHCNERLCHNSIDRAAQIVLDNHADLQISANDGSLLGSMRHSPGFIPMPEGLAKLDNCTIELVADWINQGALNN